MCIWKQPHKGVVSSISQMKESELKEAKPRSERPHLLGAHHLVGFSKDLVSVVNPWEP